MPCETKESTYHDSIVCCCCWCIDSKCSTVDQSPILISIQWCPYGFTITFVIECLKFLCYISTFHTVSYFTLLPKQTTAEAKSTATKCKTTQPQNIIEIMMKDLLCLQCTNIFPKWIKINVFLGFYAWTTCESNIFQSQTQWWLLYFWWGYSRCRLDD